MWTSPPLSMSVIHMQVDTSGMALDEISGTALSVAALEHLQGGSLGSAASPLARWTVSHGQW